MPRVRSTVMPVKRLVHSRAKRERFEQTQFSLRIPCLPRVREVSRLPGFTDVGTHMRSEIQYYEDVDFLGQRLSTATEKGKLDSMWLYATFECPFTGETWETRMYNTHPRLFIGPLELLRTRFSNWAGLPLVDKQVDLAREYEHGVPCPGLGESHGAVIARYYDITRSVTTYVFYPQQMLIVTDSLSRLAAVYMPRRNRRKGNANWDPCRRVFCLVRRRIPVAEIVGIIMSFVPIRYVDGYLPRETTGVVRGRVGSRYEHSWWEQTSLWWS